jgi:hypothetical protein
MYGSATQWKPLDFNSPMMVLTLLRLNFFAILYKNPVRTSQDTQCISTTKPNRLTLFRETVAVYSENHTEHANTLCGQNAVFCCVKAGGTYSNHKALKG